MPGLGWELRLWEYSGEAEAGILGTALCSWWLTEEQAGLPVTQWGQGFRGLSSFILLNGLRGPTDPSPDPGEDNIDFCLPLFHRYLVPRPCLPGGLL